MHMYAVLVEKILRVQPDVHKIYLIVRGIDAKQRVQQEVLMHDIFFFSEREQEVRMICMQYMSRLYRY